MNAPVTRSDLLMALAGEDGNNYAVRALETFAVEVTSLQFAIHEGLISDRACEILSKMSARMELVVRIAEADKAQRDLDVLKQAAAQREGGAP
ncbi:MAG TPA: hypothetical protein VHB79_10410 [Polyangiaceae bacterium]|nr:hypothetical protein [Polyangiaceae bacterium]